jgi:hypothetical protein
VPEAIEDFVFNPGIYIDRFAGCMGVVVGG